MLIGMHVNVVMASTEQPISFLQYDTQWGDIPYTSCSNSRQTIGNSGCGPTAMAMVIHYYADETITPIETAKYAVENGYRTYNSGTAHGFFGSMAKKYDIEYLDTYSSAEAFEWMKTKTDPLIICSMGPGLWTNNGHFILVWNIDEYNNVDINDPGSTQECRIRNSFTNLTNSSKRYFCFNKTEMYGWFDMIVPNYSIYNMQNVLQPYLTDSYISLINTTISEFYIEHPYLP